MHLDDLEQHILAYYLIKGAADLNMDPRWWPPIELSSIIEDKVRFAVSRFDLAGRAAVDHAARDLLGTLIERQAFSTSESRFGPMYQFQRPVFLSWLTEAQDANPIIARAASTAPEYWQLAFARLKSE